MSPQSRPVERLDFIDSDPRIYRMLSRCWGALNQLACVHVYLGKGRDFDLLSTLLADTKDSLQELHIHVSQNFCNDKWLVTVNLDQLLDIGHLRDVSVHMWGVGMPSIPVLRWILASFRSCRSPSQLETIHFVVNLAGTSRPDMEQDFGFWRALDDALSGSQFERLRSIRVDIVVPETIMEQIGKGIEKQFASVDGRRRRMLSVVQVDKLVSGETYD
ncbi:hypothetical protein BDZ89DRAFT_1133540 [Hymenopellis radicata]|nr:hypothetical protein BDZ89DRAFT_1133540 [Hymenopellis radicata]